MKKQKIITMILTHNDITNLLSQIGKDGAISFAVIESDTSTEDNKKYIYKNTVIQRETR